MKRYQLLDSIRGLALINMILYHALWDLVYIFGINLLWFRSPSAHLWQQAICCTFILLSGFCQPLGSHKLQRSITVIACSLIITIVSVVFMPGNIIWSGVLTLLGSAMLIFSFSGKILNRINPFVGFILALMLFVFAKNTDLGYVGFRKYIFHLPDWLYANIFTAYLGFPPENFSSADYFPLIPWLFLFAAGFYLNRIFGKLGIMRFLYRPRMRLLEFVGRHSLIIYMIHQPVIYAILYIIL